MWQSRTYVRAKPNINAQPKDSPSDENFLGILSNHALSDREAGLDDVKRDLRQQVMQDTNDDAVVQEGVEVIIKRLKDQGYIRDKKKWLAHHGFELVGDAILREIMRNVEPKDAGDHRINAKGAGESVLESTRKFEPGEDIMHISAQDTLLNAARRGRPLGILPDDIEEYETEADAMAAIVYCIDLSSTMKTKTNGISRIRAAKKALWGLYMANTKYFPRDSVHVIGFASMAARINPRDIPYLRTFDANDFLHYTNYQAALRLAHGILAAEPVQNKRIVLITDGQPSACYVENQYQRDGIRTTKPYANFYTPEKDTIHDVMQEKSMRLDTAPDRQVYLCYRYKKVDEQVHQRTLTEGKRCQRDGMGIEIVVISDEDELMEYADNLAHQLGGTYFHVQDDMGRLVTSYMRRTMIKHHDSI